MYKNEVFPVYDTLILDELWISPELWEHFYYDTKSAI